MVAHHASPGSEAAEPRGGRDAVDAALRPGRADAAFPRPALAARRQPADHLAGAVLAPRRRRAAGLPARALGHAGRRLHRRRLRRRGRRRRAAAGAVPRPGRLVGAATTRWPSRTVRAALGWRYRGAALPRLLGRAEPGAARLPLGRLRGDRLDAASGCAQRQRAPLLAVGISLGGNALLRWAEEAGDSRRGHGRARWPRCRSPIDLAAGGHAIGRGFNRQVYTRMFLRTMKPKALRKWQQHPGLFDRERLLRGAHAVRVRQRLHRAAARLSRHRRLLGARLGQAAPAAHPHPGAGAERAQRPLRAGRVPARGRTRSGASSRCGSRRTAATSALRSGRFPGHVLSLPEAVTGWLQTAAR